MNYKLAWNRLIGVLIVLWCILWIALGIGGKDSAFPMVLIVAVVGSAVIFGLMKAIAWIASGLFQSSQD